MWLGIGLVGAVVFAGLGSGCTARDSGYGPTSSRSGGSVHQFHEGADSAPDAACTKPDSHEIVAVSSADGGKVRIEVQAGNSKAVVVPMSLVYARYSEDVTPGWGFPPTGTEDTSVSIDKTLNLTCDQGTAGATTAETIVFECGFAAADGSFSEVSNGGRGFVAHELVLVNPDCDRRVTYDDRLVWFNAPDRLPEGLDGKSFPEFYTAPVVSK